MTCWLTALGIHSLQSGAYMQSFPALCAGLQTGQPHARCHPHQPRRCPGLRPTKRHPGLPSANRACAEVNRTRRCTCRARFPGSSIPCKSAARRRQVLAAGTTTPRAPQTKVTTTCRPPACTPSSSAGWYSPLSGLLTYSTVPSGMSPSAWLPCSCCLLKGVGSTAATAHLTGCSM